MTTTNTSSIAPLIEADVLSAMIKTSFDEKLIGQQFITPITFDEANTIYIPSIGKIAATDFNENGEITFSSADTGTFSISVTDYKQAAVAITDKAKQDAKNPAAVVGKMTANITRAIEESVEADQLSLINRGQTAGDFNVIDGYKHRYFGSAGDAKLALKDLRQAKAALRQAGVPLTNLVMVADPSVEESIRTDATVLAAIQNTPRWADLITSGFSADMVFLGSVEGIDIYTSTYVPTIASETLGGTTKTGLKANMVFSADPSVETLLWGWKQAPEAEMFRNTNAKRDEYSVTARFGGKLYRPEAAVSILTKTDVF